MTDDNPNEHKFTPKADKPIETSDAHSARNAELNQIKTVQSSNKNHHSGSAGGDQDHSLEIIGFNATASRGSELKEKDLIEKSPALHGRIEQSSRQENAPTEQLLLERISALPIEQQIKVICAGAAAYNREISDQQYQIAIAAALGLGKGVTGIADGFIAIGNSIGEIATFSAEFTAGKPEAAEKISGASKLCGRLFVGCVGAIGICDEYLGGLGAAAYYGDSTKVLRDISHLGAELDRRWEALTPAQKTELVTQIGTQTLGEMLLGAGISKLSKSATIVKDLEEIGTQAAELGSSARAKHSDFIAQITEKLLNEPRIEPATRLTGIEQALAGKPFGKWNYFNEVPAPEMVRQSEPTSCVAACGEYLTRGRTKQAELIEKIKAPAGPLELGIELGPDWRSDYFTQESIYGICQTGEWTATLRNRFVKGHRAELGHNVIVEGLIENGRITILDPWEATRYEMTIPDFLLHWDGCATFKK